MNLPEPILVSDEETLQACVEQCSGADAIALDTEFVRTDTFYPELGLIQVCDGERVWLLDPLAIADFGSLKVLLLDESVVKVFHSCSEDLEVLRYCFDLTPTPIFDTQIAAAFLDYGYSRGYSTLVETVLDVQLDKHETRSDWLQRPLSDSQMRYAAEDVYYLLKVYRKLALALQEQGRESWMAEEMTALETQAATPEEPANYYLRVKGAWKLSEEELALLRDLTCWREEEARRRNRPRNRVVADRAFLDLLKLRPQQVEGLLGVDGMHKGIVRRYGETLLAMAGAEPDTQGLQQLEQPLDREGKGLLARCRDMLNERAEQLGLAVELLARKKDLEPLVWSAVAGAPQLPERLASGWRYPLVGEDLLECARSWEKKND